MDRAILVLSKDFAHGFTVFPITDFYHVGTVNDPAQDGIRAPTGSILDSICLFGELVPGQSQFWCFIDYFGYWQLGFWRNGN